MQVNFIAYKNKLQKIFLKERQQWFLWVPVFYSIGILIYLTLPFEPNIYFGIIATSLLVTLLLIFKRFYCLNITAQKITPNQNISKYNSNNGILFSSLLILFLVCAGFSGANIRAVYVKAPTLEKEIKAISIQGKISDINTYKKGHRVILTDIKTDKIPAAKTPKNIRLTVLTNIGNSQVGDIIEVIAVLSPPPLAVLPGTYNFAQNAFFQQIGAVGFSVSDFNKISPGKNLFFEKIQQLRNIIAQRLVDSIGGNQAEIAKALFIGDTGGIDNASMDAIRNSGLAHLLSISGLHMVIVCTIFFTISRILLTLYAPIALNFNTKKLAALCAIIGSYFYLLISGNPFPALRSFFMSSMVLMAIILDRSGTPLRIVAFAAMYILITAPESIISPSFQMSFSAVIGLIAAFEWLTPHLQKIAAQRRIPRIFMSILGTIISSIVATLATAPFAIYHFNRNSPYGVFANILAIPVTSFEIMPFGMIAIMLMPFHLEWITQWPLRLGIDFVIWIANYVSSLPYAGSTIPAINNWQLLLISFGFLWLTIWKTPWRLLGIGFALVAVTGSFFNKTADVIISSDGALFAVKNEQGDLIFSTNKTARYSRSVWSSRSGQEDTQGIKESVSNLINCDIAGCNYNNKGYRVSFIQQPIALESECINSDIFINLTGVVYNCSSAKKQINSYALRKDGAHEIFLGDKITINTVSSKNPRLWER